VKWTSTSAKREAKARFWSLAMHPIVRHNDPCLDHYRKLLMCKAPTAVGENLRRR